MLEKITGTFSNIVRTISGKSTITEKNIEETVEQIKMALLEADVNLRVVRRFVNSTIEEAKGEKVLKSVNPGQQFVKIIHDKPFCEILSDRTGRPYRHGKSIFCGDQSADFSHTFKEERQ